VTGDSVLTASGTGTAAASAESGATLLLRHSDAIGSTRGSAALRVVGCTGNFLTCPGGPASLDAQDVIAKAGGATLVLSATCNTACSGPVASMSLNHSIDHGAPYDRMASSDIDGNPRSLGAATDIGADELVP
jgi:hypothetical protein